LNFLIDHSRSANLLWWWIFFDIPKCT